MKLHELTIHQAHALLKNKEISSQELTRATLDRIDALEKRVGAFITVTASVRLCLPTPPSEAWPTKGPIWTSTLGS